MIAVKEEHCAECGGIVISVSVGRVSLDEWSKPESSSLYDMKGKGTA
jgi:hypothetical protein